MYCKLEVFIYKLPISCSQCSGDKREPRSKSRGYSNGSFKFVIGSKEESTCIRAISHSIESLGSVGLNFTYLFPGKCPSNI